MPETYDPQKVTFIKKPVVETCITCGQPLPTRAQPMSNEMNNYLNILSGKTVTINSGADTLNIQGVTLYKVTGISGEGKPFSKFAPKPEPQAEVPKPQAPTPIPTVKPSIQPVN